MPLYAKFVLGALGLTFFLSIHLQDLAVGLIAAGLDFSYFQDVNCSGLVPSSTDLMTLLGTVFNLLVYTVRI